jgi:flagellar biosynthesis/type III secretory pathway M-ring protein FliF/YscJ
MFVLLNGAVGYWDELAIAVLALAVLWIAVRLAGRNRAPGQDDEDDSETADTDEADEREADSPPPGRTLC